MSASLKLVSINIERHKHLDFVEEFLALQKPDVVSLQEVFEHDLERFAQALGGASYVFEPMTRRPDEPPPGILGIGILSRQQIRSHAALYYVGKPGVLPDSFQTKAETYNSSNRILLRADLEKEGSQFRILTTHFTWTPDGQPDDVQRSDIGRLLRILEEEGAFVLTGDFNAPRGGEIFSMLAAKYKDNIPERYQTSLDIALHRVGKTHPEQLSNKMVDGLFSTPAYTVSAVELVSGVSDHCAIVAKITRSA